MRFTIAFFVEKLINRKLNRITIGRYPEISPDMARKKATELLGKTNRFSPLPKIESVNNMKNSEMNGQAYANLAMRVLRALFNFASGQYEDAQGKSLIMENPVRRLSQTRAWYRVERRQTYIKPHKLGAWYAAFKNIENGTLRDYLLLILLTGLRREEAATLMWENVDLLL